MNNKIPFLKPYTSAHDLVRLLQSRGLIVSDTAKAESYLEYIGYYRLSAYMYPLLQMPKEQHHYKPNTTFEQVMMLYRFDKNCDCSSSMRLKRLRWLYEVLLSISVVA